MEMNEKHTHGKVEIHRISIKYVRICWLLFLLLRFFLFHSPFSLARSNGLRKKERERERSGPMSILTIISDWLSAIVNVCAFRCEGQMHTFLKISPSAAICTIPLALNILFFFFGSLACVALSRFIDTLGFFPTYETTSITALGTSSFHDTRRSDTCCYTYSMLNVNHSACTSNKYNKATPLTTIPLPPPLPPPPTTTAAKERKTNHPPKDTSPTQNEAREKTEIF